MFGSDKTQSAWLEKHNVFSIPVLRINSDPQTHNQRNTFKRRAQFANVLAKTTVSPTSICSGSWNQLILSGIGPQHRLIFKSSHRGDSNPLEGSHLQGKPQSKCCEDVLAPQKARLPPLAAISPSLMWASGLAMRLIPEVGWKISPSTLKSTWKLRMWTLLGKSFRKTLLGTLFVDIISLRV